MNILPDEETITIPSVLFNKLMLVYYEVNYQLRYGIVEDNLYLEMDNCRKVLSRCLSKEN